MGRKKQPFYRIVAIDSRIARNGKYIDNIGHYNPVVNPPQVVIDEERAFLWLRRGAELTATVKNLLSKQGILLKWHLMKKGASQEKIEDEVKKWELTQLDKNKKVEALKAQQENEKISKKQAQAKQESETPVDASTEANNTVIPEASASMNTENTNESK